MPERQRKAPKTPGEVVDAITILAIVLFNGILGFVQEWKAERALTALKQMLSPRCRALRDGREQEIDAETLVPGDLVLLKIGDRVPADLRLIDAVNLKADESALTGESASVLKQRSQVSEDTPLALRSPMAWMGTNITNGRGKGVVVATGMETEFGRIAELTRSVEEEATPLQRKLAVLGRQLGMLGETSRATTEKPLWQRLPRWQNRACELLPWRVVGCLPGSRWIKMDEDEVENQLTLLAVVGIIDPPRKEASEAIRLAKSAGIRVLMVTGDAAATALAIGKRIGLRASCTLTGSELSKLDDQQLREFLARDALFARTTPEHKLRLVRLLQEDGHVVGMTGDGVNDAPALKQADIGIAMGMRGTDVAKGAADMVLTDDNFASIVGAIEEGRRQYDNIQKFVRYLLSSNVGELLAVLLNILLGGPLILLPVQILWMNLVTDGFTAVALGLEPAEDVMRRPPRSTSQPILDRVGILWISVLGGYVALTTLWLFHHALASGRPLALAHTVAFTGIVILEKLNVFNFRSLHQPLAAIGPASNRWLLVAWVGTLGLQVAAVYVPFLQNALHTVALGWRDWALMFLVAAPILVVTEGVKWFRSKRTPSAT